VEIIIDLVVALRFGIRHETATLLGKAKLNVVARILIEAARGCLLQKEVDYVS